jgi:hypothetical protein
MVYRFAWRRRFFWKSLKVMGHRYEKDQNKMVLFFEDGSVRELKEWTSCEVFLRQDWVLARKKQMESDSGLNVPLSTP